MADHVLDTSFVQTLTAIKSKVDLFLKEVSTDGEGVAVSLSTVLAEETGKEVLQRLEKALDDLTELQQARKVCIGMKLDCYVLFCNLASMATQPRPTTPISLVISGTVQLKDKNLARPSWLCITEIFGLLIQY